MLVQTCNAPPAQPLMSAESPSSHGQILPLCDIVDERGLGIPTLWSVPRLPPSDAKTGRWKVQWFLKLAAGILPCSFWKIFTSFLPPSFCQNLPLYSNPLFIHPSFILSNEGEPSHSAWECQGCDFHCEVLKVTVHSWTCILMNLAKLKLPAAKPHVSKFQT